MSFEKGKDGVVKMGDPLVAIAHIQEWNLDIEADQVSGWGMGDDAETTFTTITRWSGSFKAYFDAGDSSFGLSVGDEIAIELYPGGQTAGKHYWSGNCAITSTPHSASKDGIVEITVNFSNRGPLAGNTVAS